MFGRLVSERSYRMFPNQQQMRSCVLIVMLFALFVWGCGGTQKSDKDASGATYAQQRSLEDLSAKLARATFALGMQELSHVGETDERFQIILRTG